MARPPTICDEALLEAAREVFFSRGIRATTAEVASAAGISEGSIFKRYKTKADLFETALSSLMDREPEFVAELPARVGKGDVREHLTQIGNELLAHFHLVVPAYMLAWSNPGPDGVPCMLSGGSPKPMMLLAAIQRYFGDEMALGRLAARPPEVLARIYMGAIHNYVVFRQFFPSLGDPTLPALEFIDGLVLALWEGMDPGPRADAPRTRKASKR